MNDKNKLYQIQLDEAQLAAFRIDMLALHEELTEMFLNSSESADFPEANAVIDRIRNLG